MKRMGFLSVVILAISAISVMSASTTALAERDSADNQKYWDTLSFRFMGTLNSEWSFANRMNLFAFYDPNLDVYNEVPTGFAFGTGMHYRPAKYYDLFMDISFHRTQFLVGKKGDTLRGPWIVVQFGGNSPVLSNDVYYSAQTGFLRLGGRAIYPINKSIEPWVGFAYGLAAWQVAFSNKDMSTAYSDVVSGQNFGYSILAGVDFNILSQGRKFMTIGAFFDGGRVIASPLKFNDLIWIGHSYESTASPAILPLRLGVSISMAL